MLKIHFVAIFCYQGDICLVGPSVVSMAAEHVELSFVLRVILVLQAAIATTAIRQCIVLISLFHIYICYRLMLTASVVWWSEFLATDPEARVRFPALP
jgi:hypothetical protein